MALDIGLATGLAYRHDFQKDIRNRAMIQQLKRQKKIDNQTESRLWAKELETMSVQNPYDAAGLEKFLDGHYKKMGKWLQEHPNFRENPSEFLTWTSKYVKPIKDNVFVRRDLSFQEQKKLYSKYVSTYGKGHWKTELMSKQMESYRTMGNIDGDPAGGVKEFMFSAPYDGFDPLKIIRTEMGALSPGPDQSKRDSYGNIWYGVSEANAKNKIKQIISDPTVPGMYEEWFNNLNDNQKTSNDIIEHLYNVGKGNLKTKFGGNPYKGSQGSRRQGKQDTESKDFFKEVVVDVINERQKSGYDPIVTADKVALDNMMANSDGETINIGIDTKMQINFATQGDNIVSEVIDLGLKGDYNFNTTGPVKRMKDNAGAERLFAEAWITVGEDQATQAEEQLAGLAQKIITKGKYKDQNAREFELDGIFDYKNLNNIWGISADEMDDIVIRAPFRGSVRLKAKKDDQNAVEGIQFKVWIPINDDPSSRLRYANTEANKFKAGTQPTGNVPSDFYVKQKVRLSSGRTAIITGFDVDGKVQFVIE